jgi:hypothetical protein
MHTHTHTYIQTYTGTRKHTYIHTHTQLVRAKMSMLFFEFEFETKFSTIRRRINSRRPRQTAHTPAYIHIHKKTATHELCHAFFLFTLFFPSAQKKIGPLSFSNKTRVRDMQTCKLSSSPKFSLQSTCSFLDIPFGDNFNVSVYDACVCVCVCV